MSHDEVPIHLITLLINLKGTRHGPFLLFWLLRLRIQLRPPFACMSGDWGPLSASCALPCSLGYISCFIQHPPARSRIVITTTRKRSYELN
eukprot:389330-Pleurochrysis_carterae.AAC.2